MSIRPKGNGLEVRVYTGVDPVTGKKRSISRYVKGQDQAAQRKAEKLERRLQREVEEGKHTHSGRTLLRDFLREWLTWSKGNVSPGTYRRYEELATMYIAPELARDYEHRRPEGVIGLGHLRLDRLTTEAVDLFLSSLTTVTSPANAHHVFRVLRRALNVARRWKRIPSNPCSGYEVDPPKVPEQEFHVPTVTEVNAILKAAEGDRLYALLMLSSRMGPRQGEVLGLKWTDIDRAAGTITFARTLVKGGRKPVFGRNPTKNRKVRVIKVPEGVLEALDQLRVEQEIERSFYGEDYQDFGLVFCTKWGTPYYVNSITRRFRRILREAGIEVHMRWHDLRHGAATHLLRAGNDPNTVAEILGHHSGSFTVAKYGHAVGDKGAAMRRLEAYYAASTEEEPEA